MQIAGELDDYQRVQQVAQGPLGGRAQGWQQDQEQRGGAQLGQQNEGPQAHGKTSIGGR